MITFVFYLHELRIMFAWMSSVCMLWFCIYNCSIVLAISRFLPTVAMQCSAIVMRCRLSVCRLSSVTRVYFDLTVSWIRMPLGMEAGLGPSDIVLDGDPCHTKPNPTHWSLGLHLWWEQIAEHRVTGLRPSSTSTCRCTLNILRCLMEINVCSDWKCTSSLSDSLFSGSLAGAIFAGLF